MTRSSKSARTLIVVLGDQLSHGLVALRGADKSASVVLMAEVEAEATYVRHHKKKIAFVFSAMRHFAAELEDDGWDVDYTSFGDRNAASSLTAEIERAMQRHAVDRVVITEPGEWRLKTSFDALRASSNVAVEILEDDRYVCGHDEFADWARGRKQLRMEYFYREMRRKTGLLMDGDEPAEGRWNFDSENRKPPGHGLDYPGPMRFEPDGVTQQVLDLVDARFADHFGDSRPFWFAVTRRDAERALGHFVRHGLPRFGDYQDAMVGDERFLFHAVIAQYLNIGLLDPLAVCRRVESAYRDGAVEINAAEGFIRQIIGWREYVRGIYWQNMPTYVDRNFFESNVPLPSFYWTAETDMRCLERAITQTKEDAYAHHIQRLMVTGNFAMLAGIAPRAVHEWYLAVYADAYEWVELPNTLGMSQFADGGLLGSKPYAASGNYINKMSDYCRDCVYDVKKKTGDGACPFNYLYWDFLVRNRGKLEKNPRVSRAFSTWDRMSADRRADTLEDAARFLDALA